MSDAVLHGGGVAFDDLLRDGGLHCVYQPFVDLDTGSVMAFEALLRGPAGTGWQSPTVLLDAARAAGRLADLEQASLRSSLTDAACQGYCVVPFGLVTVGFPVVTAVIRSWGRWLACRVASAMLVAPLTRW